MKQKLVPLSVLLIISLLAWTANADMDDIVDTNSITEEDISEENITEEENISEEDISEEDISEENISEEDITEENITEENITEENIEEENIEEENIEEENIEEDISEENIEEENIEEENIEEENIEEENIEEENIEEENIEEEDIEEDIEEENIEEENIEEENIEEENIEEENIEEENIEEENIEEENIEEENIEEENIEEEDLSEEDGEEDLSEEDSANRIVEISYNESGPFKIEDVVGITATFNEPVLLATLTVNDDFSSPIDMVNVNDTVWYCEYVVPDGVNAPVDVIVSAVDEEESSIDETDAEAFVIDNTLPEFTRIEPELDFVSTNCVVFNFSAYDELDDSIDYTFYFNGTESDTGELAPEECKKVELDLAEGHYTWEVKLEDDAGNIWSSDVVDLYVDTEAPKVTLISPEDHLIDTGDCFNLSFTAKDDFTDQYEDLNLHYELYIDGEIVEEQGSGDMCPWEYIQVPCSDLKNGAHEWSVYVADDAGNNVTSDTRYIYVDQEDLRVLLISPDGGYASADTIFKFRVSGGAGLPFDYKLLINGEEIESSVCEEDSISEDGEEEEEDISEDEEEEEEDISEGEEEEEEDSISEDEEEDNISEDEEKEGEDNISEDEEEEEEDSISEDEEDNNIFEEGENTLFLGEDPVNYYSLNAEVEDGDGIEWTVLITDCTGDTYQPDPYYFSLDTAAPERVANLTVRDVTGETEWAYTYDYPRLYARWDENTEDDLTSMPYEVFISDFVPSSLDEMEKIGSTSDTSFYIDEYGGEPLVYGKDYWVAVITRDNAGNYNDCFVAIYGPVQTYGDIDSESVESSISDTSSGFLTGIENEDVNSGSLNDPTLNTSSELLAENELSGSLNDSTSNTSSEFLTGTDKSESLNDSTSNTGLEFLTGDKNSEELGEKSRAELFRNLIPQLNKTVLKPTNLDSLDKQVPKYAEDSAEPKSAPGFHIIYAATSILLLAFGSNLKRKPGRKL